MSSSENLVAEYGFSDDVINDFELEWENFIDIFSDLIKRKNPEDDAAIATVGNFGWRNINGYCFIDDDDCTPEKILRKILPDTDCSFKIFETDYGFDLQNYHHDSPMGNEWYEVTFLTDNERYKIMSEMTGVEEKSLRELVSDENAEWDGTEFCIFEDYFSEDNSLGFEDERYDLVQYFAK